MEEVADCLGKAGALEGVMPINWQKIKRLKVKRS